ncbi:YiiX/YebB-like N1pC/P60 family cysteine hydrolase [Vibrio fluvialis]
MIGDIFLVRGGRKSSSALVGAQKLIYNGVKSSHVEMSIGDGSLVHSTNDGGVHFVFLLDELKDIKDDWKVIRLKGITEQEQEELAKAALYYLRQGYNKKFMGNGEEDASFCSELIAKIYKKAGVPLLDEKLPSKIAPAHFDRLAGESEQWEDVTDEYLALIEKIKENEFPFRFAFNTIKSSMVKRSHLSSMRQTVFQAIQKNAEDSGDQRQIDFIEKVKQKLVAGRILDFWDETDTIPYKSQSDRKK